jgi:prolyl oligopeptidase
MRNLTSLAVLLGAANLLAAPPETARQPVTDAYHGVKVVDDYRWLEDWSDPDVKAWSAAQNAHARSVLDALPNVEPIRRRLQELMGAELPSYGAVRCEHNVLVAMKRQPPKQQPFLVVVPSATMSTKEERVLLDPGVLDPSGQTSIDWFELSPDGSLVAVSLSKAGSELGDLYIYNTQTGAPVGEPIARVNGGTAGGSMAWEKGGRGFFYTRYPREGERAAEDMNFFVQVYFHELGAPESSDRYEVGKDFPRIAEIQLQTHPVSGNILATVQNGDGGEFMFYLRGDDGQWTKLIDYSERVVHAKFGFETHELFVISRKGAPRGQVLRMDWTRPNDAKVIVKESADTIVWDFWEPGVFVTTPSHIIATYQTGGPSEVRIFDHAGKPLAGPAQLPVGAINFGIVPLSPSTFLFNNASYLEPAAWYAFDGATTRKTDLKTGAAADFSDCEVVREFAISQDGTKVPVNIIHRKGLKLDGSHPCLLSGYGGYGVSITPSFSAADRALVEQGVIIAEANIRGGGEYGDEWHRQGNLLNKQNVFDDFAAACRHLAKRGYTSPERLAIIGGSNGGLLMGATLTQNPKLMACVVSSVGIYDMLRVELSPNGAFNIPEFGTVKDAAQFKAMHAYSPYHHVADGTKYPPVLFLTGANDPRVDPMQSRKMTARLQAAGADVLLRTSDDSGHGAGTALSERIAQNADVHTFVLHHLGVQYQPVEPVIKAPAAPGGSSSQ